MDWFNEGREAAELFLAQAVDSVIDDQPDEPECPWPIYAPEGAEWLKGWNSVADENDGRVIAYRPPGHGWMFEPASP